ncbi:MAG: hypothetical protein QXX68_03040 [Candidatus Pacearchaeota archaeon]
MKKRADFNFVWLFAIIAGTSILVLMIYAAVRTGKTITTYQDTDLAKQVISYLDPFQAGSVAALKGTFSSKREIVFESSCDSTNFGYQTLAAKQIRDLNEDFNVFGEEITIKNKYVYFSKKPSKNFYVFSVPISFAFEVGDALIVGSEEFCFLEGYENIPYFKNTLSNIGAKVFFDEANCTENSIRVCFNYGADCDIQVIGDCSDSSWCDHEYETGQVIKDGESLEYVGNLIYPALFSDKENYDCNLKRFFYKNGMLSLIYVEKSDRMSSRNCPTDLTEELSSFSQLSFNNPNLKELYKQGKLIKEKEGRTLCHLWS